MNLANSPPQSIGRLRNRDQMDMVGHQAVCQDVDVVNAAPVRHQFQVALVVVVAKERLLPAISPLGDVMRDTRRRHSC